LVFKAFNKVYWKIIAQEQHFVGLKLMEKVLDP